ncbi:hypothetical protein BCR23_03325 [Enterococcus quebecensis]|uniref:DGQHR domain-containing protein n=2 Tax=Enterococcus quebecensis TaxID=903983 RepID=A0A1E5GXC9_9ENTE|nr:hypothetical protein BCR23_03325 [Enterococcus quebecensis]
MFYKLGFTIMNKDRNFHMPYDKNGKLTKQIDVFCADDETVLFIECKHTNEINKKTNFKKDIEAINGVKGGLISEINKRSDTPKKVKFILATQNYNLSTTDKERLEGSDIAYFDEDALQYYEELSKHLGKASRFQLLGQLFEKQRITGMENKIPAIQGQMGGLDYYAFSIEPDKLLKMSYVLHKSNFNKDQLPSYQRIIKKSRLNKIQEFVKDGGFFPNSIVVNIDKGKKDLRFDTSSLQDENSISKIGILHLPPLYQSIYIIDGQHRLYGYSDTEYSKINSIPVVAFVNLKKNDQIKLFMEINENQKSVSKNLRNTLNADLLWDSPLKAERTKALLSKIAQRLGEDENSPLYDRVVIGENQSNSKTCIKIETIIGALNKTNFVSKFNKDNETTSNGLFDKGNNDSTFIQLYSFILESFSYIKRGAKDEWEKGEDDDGVLTINVGIHGFIMLICDLINYKRNNEGLDTLNGKPEDLLESIKPYLDTSIRYINDMSHEDKIELKKSYGSQGKPKYWKRLQVKVHSEHRDFNPDGISESVIEYEKTYNEEARILLPELEKNIKVRFERLMIEHFGENWVKDLPKKVYKSAAGIVIERNYDSSNDEEYLIEDVLTLNDYANVSVDKSNWRDIFEKYFTRPQDEGIKGGKIKKIEWLKQMDLLIQKNLDDYSITSQDNILINELKDWLIEE